MPEMGTKTKYVFLIINHNISLFSPTEKPVLQSRHSLDGSKLVEKVETAQPQPLWVTLALQKQKGFREQQATREERKQARETKQAEKLPRENVSSLVFSFNFAFLELGSLFMVAGLKKERLGGSGVEYLGRVEQ